MINTLEADTIGLESNFNPFETPPKKILWGVAPTGDIHLGYAAPFYLLQQLRERGSELVLLIANFHAYLDSKKTKWGELDQRVAAYRCVFETAGFDKVIETRAFYLNSDYIEAFFEISGRINIDDVLQAGETTLRASTDKYKVADLVYVTTQILDVKYLTVDCVLCGIDESPIYRFGLPLLAKHYDMAINYIYMPMCPGIEKPEMHASDHSSNKILVSDTPVVIQQKVEKHLAAFSKGENRHSLAEYCRDVLFPLADEVELAVELTAAMNISRSKLANSLSTGISKVLSPWQESGRKP